MPTRSLRLPCAGLSPTTLILIASAGHSGSTLLDLLLGNHPDVSSAGEMNRLTLFADDRVCACGEVVSACDYWSRVRTALARAAGRTAIHWDDCQTDVAPQDPVLEIADPGVEPLCSGREVPAAIRRQMAEAGLSIGDAARLERSGQRDFKWRVLENGRASYVLRRKRHAVQVFPEELTWKAPLRRLPDALEVALVAGSTTALAAVARVSRRASLRIDAARNSLHVADAMAAVDGVRYVVDSSKSPVRLKLLQMLRPERVRILHLVRDGRAVSASAVRRSRISVEKAARIWKRDNQNLDRMLRTVPARDRHRVSYEALCEDPAAEVGRICGFLDVAYDPSMLELWSRPVHNIPGNPMLFDRRRRGIAVDRRWRRDLSAADLEQFDRVAGDVNRALGYA